MQTWHMWHWFTTLKVQETSDALYLNTVLVIEYF